MVLGRWCAHVHMCRVYVCCDGVFNLCSSMLSWKWAYFFSFNHSHTHSIQLICHWNSFWRNWRRPLKRHDIPFILYNFASVQFVLACDIGFSDIQTKKIAKLMFIVCMTDRKKSMRSMVSALFFVFCSDSTIAICGDIVNAVVVQAGTL